MDTRTEYQQWRDELARGPKKPLQPDWASSAILAAIITAIGCTAYLVAVLANRGS